MWVTVVGDATLDVTVAPRGPMQPAGDTPAAIQVGPGGQGANVAVRLARRGVAAHLVAPIADDDAGRLLRARLAAEGVELIGLEAARSGVVVSMLAADGERSMLSHRAPLPDDRSALDAALADAPWIHCSGYVLRDERAAGVVDLLRSRTAMRRLSVSGGSLPFDAGEVAAFARALDSVRPDLVLAGRDEARALLGQPASALDELAAELASRFSCGAVVTGGRDGSAAAVGPLRLRDRPDRAAAMVDATGAGDAFAAALIAVLHAEDWPPDEPVLSRGLAAAGRAGAQAVGVLGSQAEILDEAGISS